MKCNERKTVSTNLFKFDCLAKENSFIEVTQWTNEEGWDININDKNISLTRGEIDAINCLTSYLDYLWK